MADASGKRRIRLNLALQGGGSHGAFTWGVLDRLLAVENLEITGISGTSAGAVNGTVMAWGLARSGPQAAREDLARFWNRTSEVAAWSPLRPSFLDRLTSRGNMDLSPAWHWFDSLSRLLSPYQFNPAGLNPLAPLLKEVVDFEGLREKGTIPLFLAATNVRNGRIRVFERPEIRLESVLASTCLPRLFRAVQIYGEYYWDGGFMGNPPIYPLIYGTDCEDVLIIQINPINIPQVPTTPAEIEDRENELAFNSSLMREMRAIDFVTRLLDSQKIDRERYKRLNIHMIGAEEEMAPLSYSSKLNSDREFLYWLFELGRGRAETWIETHLDKVGETSSIDIADMFL